MDSKQFVQPNNFIQPDQNCRLSRPRTRVETPMNDPMSSMQHAFGYSIMPPKMLKYQCPACPIIKTLTKLKEHIIEDHLEWQCWQCSSCSAKRCTETKMNDHMYAAHGKLVMINKLPNPEKSRQLKEMMQAAKASVQQSSQFVTPRPSAAPTPSLALHMALPPHFNTQHIDAMPRSSVKGQRPQQEIGMHCRIKSESTLMTLSDGEDELPSAVGHQVKGSNVSTNPVSPENTEDEIVCSSTQSVIAKHIKSSAQLKSNSTQPQTRQEMNEPSSTPAPRRRARKGRGRHFRGASRKKIHKSPLKGKGNRLMNQRFECKRCGRRVARNHRTRHARSHMVNDEQVTLYRCSYPSCNYTNHYKNSVGTHIYRHHNGQYKVIETDGQDIERKYEEVYRSCFGDIDLEETQHSNDYDEPARNELNEDEEMIVVETTEEPDQRVQEQRVQEQSPSKQLKLPIKRQESAVSIKIKLSKRSIEEKELKEETPATQKRTPRYRVPKSGCNSNAIYCLYCKKYFSAKLKDNAHILQHVATHLNSDYKKPRYKCRHCDVAYAHKSTIRLHCVKQHGDITAYTDAILTWNLEEIKTISLACFGEEEYLLDKMPPEWSQYYTHVLEREEEEDEFQQSSTSRDHASHHEEDTHQEQQHEENSDSTVAMMTDDGNQKDDRDDDAEDGQDAEKEDQQLVEETGEDIDTDISSPNTYFDDEMEVIVTDIESSDDDEDEDK